jgi:hypothetical protein
VLKRILGLQLGESEKTIHKTTVIDEESEDYYHDEDLDESIHHSVPMS